MEEMLQMKKGIQDYNIEIGQTISYLKPMQTISLKHIVTFNDTFIVLPTGYGKSLVYEVLPYVVRGCIIMCVCPLTAIIKQEVCKLNARQEVAIDIKDMTTKYNSSTTKYIFGHPEDFSSSDIFERFSLENVKVYLVVDEAHCVIEWGTDFRPAFSKIGDMLAFVNATIIAMSATVTPQKRDMICHILKMKNPKWITCSPVLNDNICLLVRRRPNCSNKYNVEMTYERVFKIYLFELLKKGDQFETTIIYTKLKWCSFGISLAHRILGQSIYKGPPMHENLRVVQYHSPQTNEVILCIKF
jgi:superfamily II DNA helicase RecQ